MICGTLPYMSPEQFEGYADRRSDVYAFGIVLFQMATKGKLPFIGKTSEEFARLHSSKGIPFLFSPLKYIIKKCLEKNPDMRYQSFDSIREDLERLYTRKTGKAFPMITDGTENIETMSVGELSNKGCSLMKLDKYEEAIVCFDKIIELDHKNISAWNNKGFSLNRLGKSEEAIIYYDKILAINPLDEKALLNKSDALGKLRRFDEAISYCDKLLEINPNNVLARCDKDDYISQKKRE